MRAKSDRIPSQRRVRQMLRRIMAYGAVGFTMAAVTLWPTTAAQAAVAPGCTTARPTFIGGQIYGYPDNRSLNALVGLDLTDGTRKVDLDGNAVVGVVYSAVDNINPGIPPEGSTDTTLERTWGF